MDELKIPEKYATEYAQLKSRAAELSAESMRESYRPSMEDNDAAEAYRKRIAEIEEIARLTAENTALKAQSDEFESKGKELCSSYGNALITIHDLKARAEAAEAQLKVLSAPHEKLEWEIARTIVVDGDGPLPYDWNIANQVNAARIVAAVTKEKTDA